MRESKMELESYVFVSYAHEEHSAAESLCQLLQRAHIDTWVAHHDVPPGAEWDASIQSALDHASAVVVLVTASSVESAYVRAEVEYALGRGLRVVPVLKEKPIRMPLRWEILQSVDYPRSQDDWHFLKLIKQLPRNDEGQFREFLESPGRFKELRKLILDNPEWLPLGNPGLRKPHELKCDIDLKDGSTIDCLYTHPDTPGRVCSVFYLCCPYTPPILASGEPTAELQSILDGAVSHSNVICWRSDPSKVGYICTPCISVHVTVLAGRRAHFGRAAILRRMELNEQYAELIKCTWGGSVEIVSYDHLITLPEDHFSPPAP